MTITMRTAALAVATVLVLSGCGAAESDSGADPSPSPSPVVLDERPLEAQLRDAIRDGELAWVEALIEAGVDVNVDMGGSLRPLMAATMGKRHEVARALIDAGADVNAVNSQNMTALHLAVQYDDAPMVTLMLEAGSDITIESGQPIHTPPLHFAARNESTAALAAMLEFGVSPDQVSMEYGITPLVYAAWYDAPECARILVEFGADYNVLAFGEQSLLEFSRQNGSVGVTAYLESIGAAEGVAGDA